MKKLKKTTESIQDSLEAYACSCSCYGASCICTSCGCQNVGTSFDSTFARVSGLLEDKHVISEMSISSSTYASSYNA